MSKQFLICPLTGLNRWMLLLALSVGAFTAMPVRAQTYPLLFGNELDASLGNQTGAYRSAQLTSIYGLYIDTLPYEGAWSGYVAVKYSGAGYLQKPVGTIDGWMLIETEEGSLMLYFETDKNSWNHSFGWYEIVDATGAYSGASGRYGMEIYPVGGNGFSDRSYPDWRFALGW